MSQPHSLGDHLPPSASTPRVLVLDSLAAEQLANRADLTIFHGDPASLPYPAEHFDGLATTNPSSAQPLTEWLRVLRPGGRLLVVLNDPALVPSWRNALLANGLIHIYSTNELPAGTLVRGERPPVGLPIERIQAVAERAPDLLNHTLLTPATADLSAFGRYVHLLVLQTPNQPAWELSAPPRWQAITVQPLGGGPAQALAFPALVKAVQFMQAAVLAGWLTGVNKVARFPPVVAQTWPFDLLANPDLARLQSGDYSPPTPTAELDYHSAVHGEG